MFPTPELRLSEPYRLAQRAFAALLDAQATAQRSAAFAARRTLPLLRPHECAALTRWLAWLTAATAARGNLSALARIQRTDPALGRGVEALLARLPLAAPGAASAATQLRRSA